MIKVEFVLPGYSDGIQFDAEPWFAQASLEELSALDAHGWSSDFTQPVPLPLLDILLFFKNRPGTEHVGILLRDVCHGYGEWHEQSRKSALVQVDGYAALAWLNVNRPEVMKGFESNRMLRID